MKDTYIANSETKFMKLLNKKNITIFIKKGFAQAMAYKGRADYYNIRRKCKENNIIIKEMREEI